MGLRLGFAAFGGGIRVAALGMLAVCVPCTANAQGYSLTDLGPLPGWSQSYAYDINNAGKVVGYSTNGNSFRSATVWNNGTTTDLGALVGATYNTQASAINNSGQIVGGFGTLGTGGGPGANSNQQGVLWSGGTATILSPLSGFNSSFATAINNAGTVVGESYTYGTNDVVATFWTNGTPNALAMVPGATMSRAYGINNSGTVVGLNNNVGAVIWDNGVPTALGTLPGSAGSLAIGINDAGKVIGDTYILADNAWQATIWENGVATQLGVLPGQIGAVTPMASTMPVSWSDTAAISGTAMPCSGMATLQ